MAVQSPAVGGGGEGAQTKNQARILSPGFWDYLEAGVGRNRREYQGFLWSLWPQPVGGSSGLGQGAGSQAGRSSE